jgi:hypothetical protein
MQLTSSSNHHNVQLTDEDPTELTRWYNVSSLLHAPTAFGVHIQKYSECLLIYG